MNKCMYCHKILEDETEAYVSHGICQSCVQEIVIPKMRKLYSCDLENFPFETCSVNNNGEVISIEKGLEELLRNKGDSLEAYHIMLGDILGCKNASLEGGCGKQKDCANCQIRDALTWTFLTGKSIINRKIKSDFLPVTNLCISTKKIGNVVWVTFGENSNE